MRKLNSVNLFRFVSHNPSNDINILEYGYEDFTHSKAKLVPRVQFDYLLHFVISGQGIVNKNGKNLVVKKNQLFLLCPGEQMDYRPSENNPWKYFWIKFNGKMAKYFLSLAKLFEYNGIYTTSRYKEINQVFRNLIMHTASSFSADLFALAAFYDIIANIFEEQKLSCNDSESNFIIEKALEYIENNYQKADTGINSFCNSINISHSYMCKIFKAYTGKSFTRYLIDYRMTKASDLLASTNKTIQEIAFSVGYKDALYFSSKFKECYNISPKQYRNISKEILNS